MRVIDCEQGTAEWLAARTGHVTASRISDVLAKIKTGEAAARRDYKAQMVAEILTGAPAEDVYVNAAMQWGTDNEPFARAAYELRNDVMVDKVGFVLHPKIARFGGSPDGIVGTEGGIEIKCPKTATHIRWMLDGVVPAEHIPQINGNLSCTDMKWWDFISYDPRLPEHLQLFVVRTMRDEQLIALVNDEVIKFNTEVDDILARLPKGGAR